MGILNLKKTKTALTGTSVKTKKLAVMDASSKAVVSSALSHAYDASVIIRPRVTEKAAVLSEGGRTVVVFEVTREANKRNVALAIKGLYKVTPEKIAVLRVPPKRKFVRGHMITGVTGYKAYVYLKKGEKIEVI